MKKINHYFNSFLNFYIKKFFRTEKREVYIGKRKIDQFRRSIIKYRKVEEIIQYTCDFLKDFLSTQQIGFFYWHKELGHFVDYTEKENFQHKIQIFDPLILVLTEYDLILLKRNIELIRKEEHRKIILEFMNQKKANIVIPLILNESVLGLIYAKTDKYINIADYFLLDELRYFVIVTLSNALIYLSLENLLKTLEERVKERTKELEKAHQTLLQQEKMATLGTMISGIAHELNTPIGVIQASSKQITENFETLIENFFLKKDFKNLPDEFFEILYYFIFHLSISNSNVQTKAYKLKKQLKEYFDLNKIPYDDNLMNFLIDFKFYDGNNEVFINKNNLVNKIINLYNQSSKENQSHFLETLKNIAWIYESVSRISHASNVIHKLVQSLRNYSRSSKNEFLTHNLSNIIDSAINLTQNTIKHRVKIIKEYHYEGNIVCDGNQIQQVLINLIINAFHALRNIQREDPFIKIHTRELNQQVIEIQIIDNGPGIPKEIQQQVWDPFFTTKAPGEGTGLGLGIVKNIIENHHGKVYFESNQDGTIFFIQLPKNQPSNHSTKVSSHPSIKFGRYDWR